MLVIRPKRSSDHFSRMSAGSAFFQFVQVAETGTLGSLRSCGGAERNQILGSPECRLPMSRHGWLANAANDWNPPILTNVVIRINGNIGLEVVIRCMSFEGPLSLRIHLECQSEYMSNHRHFSVCSGYFTVKREKFPC